MPQNKNFKLDTWSSDFEQSELHPDDLTLNLATQLKSMKPAPIVVPAEFSTRLRTRLLNQYNEHSATQTLVRRWAVLVALGIGILGAVSVIWFSGTQRVSAAEVADRTVQAVLEPDKSGLESYEGVIVYRDREHIALESMGPLLITEQEHVWFNTPDKMRREFYRFVQGNDTAISKLTPQSTPLPLSELHDAALEAGRFALTRIVLINADSTWQYGPDQNQVSITNTIKPGISARPDVPATLQSLLTQLQAKNRTVALDKDQVVAGRSVYVIALQPKPDDATIWMSFVHDIRIYVDKQSYVQLGVEYLNERGDILSKWEYIRFTANAYVNNDLFTLNIPDGVVVKDLRVSSVPTVAELAQAWKEAAEQVQFTVFAPTKLPALLIPEKPFANIVTGQRPFNIVQQNFYTASGDDAVLMINEWPVQPDTSLPGTEKVQIGDFTANYYLIFNKRHLISIQRGNTVIQLQVAISTMSKAQLIEIAASMEPVR